MAAEITPALIPYPEFLKLSEGWVEFFYNPTTQEVLLPILATLATKKYYPEKENLFQCFYQCPLENLKVVLMGQDPYHNGSATGLCFDVKLGQPINPSLQNIYKELENEGFHPTKDGILSHWAGQGVLLLNTALSVAPGSPDSHTDLWRPFFEHLMNFLYTRDHLIWILLGKKAIEYGIDICVGNTSHCTVEASHPSPLSAHRSMGQIPAFLGSNVFSDVNDKLRARNEKEIVW